MEFLQSVQTQKYTSHQALKCSPSAALVINRKETFTQRSDAPRMQRLDERALHSTGTSIVCAIPEVVSRIRKFQMSPNASYEKPGNFGSTHMRM